MQHNATRIITPSYSPLPVIASADKGIERERAAFSFVPSFLRPWGRGGERKVREGGGQRRMSIQLGRRRREALVSTSNFGSLKKRIKSTGVRRCSVRYPDCLCSFFYLPKLAANRRLLTRGEGDVLARYTTQEERGPGESGGQKKKKNSNLRTAAMYTVQPERRREAKETEDENFVPVILQEPPPHFQRQGEGCVIGG